MGISDHRKRKLAKSEIQGALETLKDMSRRTDVQTFSISDVEITAVGRRLEELDLSDEKIFACWPAFGDGLEIQWSLFTKHFDDLWYPGRDDIIVVPSSRSWVMEINHEEFVRFGRLTTGPSKTEKHSTPNY